MDPCGSGIVNMRLYQHNNEPLFSIAGGEFLDYLGDC
jgi:hypothetical protein